MGLRGLLFTLAACAATLAVAPAALATTYTVNNGSIGNDVTPGDDVCEITASTGDCSLPAAIDEANAHAGADAIHFDSTPTGLGTSSITVTGPLPQITEQLAIDGCNGIASPTRPCIELQAVVGSFTIFDVDADSVSIKGLDVGGSSGLVGLDYETNKTGLEIKNNWFGLRFSDGSQCDNDIGTALELDGNSAQVGGTTPAERNVFSRSNGSAGSVRIDGGDDNTISGNYFATDKDGNALGGCNGATNIVVTSNGGNTASGTVIGGTLSTAAASTDACDGACNLIVNSNNDGIRLAGNPDPAGLTTIKGNYVGLGNDGSSDAGNTSLGINAGGAKPLTIGGSTPEDGNRIAGNGNSAIDASADNLTVRHNSLGLDADGVTTIFDGSSVAEMRLDGVAGSPIVVRDNRIGGNIGLAINGSGATVAGNAIGVGSGGEDVMVNDAVFVTGASNTIGGSSPGDANTIGNADNGIVISNASPGLLGNSNTVKGNFIGTTAGGADVGNDTNGVELDGDSNNNVVGGDTAADENVISNNVQSGVSMLSSTSDGNTLARNRGSGNGTEFFRVDGGANGGIVAPVITGTPTSESVSGTTSPVVANAVVRVYRTADAAATSPTGISQFVGKTTADGSGDWTLTCPSAQCASEMPGGDRVTANQTDGSGNSSGLADAAAYTVLTPDTSISSGPAAGSTINDATPTFGFSSSEAAASFQCRVDSGAFASCGSSFTTSQLGDGSHTLDVRAVDTGGHTDATPASRSFSVDTTAPDATIAKGPKKTVKTKKSKVKATFQLATEPGATLECQLDKAAFEPCTATFTAKVKKGKHTFSVRATDANGNVDQSPATQTFTVKRKKKK